jgi:hypothetical protein
VGKDAFMKLLEEGLQKTEDCLEEEPAKSHETTNTISELQKGLADTQAGLRQMTLMAKMYKQRSESSKDGAV